MNTIHLIPTDVMFFRDGRPMDGSASGHGAAWPLPHVINAAFHAAMHRSGISGVHRHREGRSSQRESAIRDQTFGSLVTVGPFPVDPYGNWYFPRPADSQLPDSAETTLRPLRCDQRPSSIGTSLRPVVNGHPPTKKKPEQWMDSAAWQAYLKDDDGDGTFIEDRAFSSSEHQVGINIAPETGTTVDGKFFSASYLRLNPEWKLGVFAEAMDKVDRNPNQKRDLIHSLLEQDSHIIVGGQQRSCTTMFNKGGEVRLPSGTEISGAQVRWTLLTPAIFPKINDHPGGWLPNWIDHNNHQVHLLDGPGKNKARRSNPPQPEGQPIRAELVAAIVPRSIPITGWALGEKCGAKSSHLAVPAGAVYYFTAKDEEHAAKLAAALNWHGDPSRKLGAIVNRRSTVFGEKGFGLGVCSPWRFH